MAKPKVIVHDLIISYKGNNVKAKKLVVSSDLPMNTEAVWEKVQRPALLQYVAKGMISFKPVEGAWPSVWEEGQTYGVKMYIFGFIPFGGVHYLRIAKIDDVNFSISTREWDNSAKVWDHDILLKPINKGLTRYQDSIIIYGGHLTKFITLFAKYFYIHRQRRWQKVSQNEIDFCN